jgi:lincosamide nucleotidyltransferase A/C/D/E
MVERTSLSPIDDALRGEKRSLRETLNRLHLLTLARTVHRLLRFPARFLLRTAINVLSLLRRLPGVGPSADSLLERIDRNSRQTVELSEVLRVCAALESAQLPFWVAGGWGLDILAGCQTRRHGDLDIALDHFWENLQKADATLTGLGYRRHTPLGGIIWFPDAAVYEDRQGHRLEVVNVNWDILAVSRELFVPTEHSGVSTPDTSGDVMSTIVARCTTKGQIAGVTLPILSLRAQRLFHRGFALRSGDQHDHEMMRVLFEEDPMKFESTFVSDRTPLDKTSESSTLLLIPIFSFPPELWRLCKLYHNDLDQMPPHITLAFPFLPLESVTSDVIQQLAKMIENIPAFDFELEEIKWFGTDVVYLEPTHSDICHSLIVDLKDKFPDFHPYNDAFTSIIPHVTLSEHGSAADRRMVGKRALKFLPISCRATHVWMMTNNGSSDSWSINKIFPFSSAHLLDTPSGS